MTKNLFKVAAVAMAMAATQGLSAQTLMDNASIHTLGEAKTWTNNADVTYTFNVEALQKAIVMDPVNTTDNIYLFPEGGYDTEANREIGIQGFYVDLGSEQEIGLVQTTWEGAAADAYDLYVTNDEPTLAILETTPTYHAENLGKYTENTAILPENVKGRYVVMQPTNATNWGWGVKMRHINIEAPIKEEILSFFSVEPAFIFAEKTPLSFTIKNQLGLPIDHSKVDVTCEGGTWEPVVFTEGETTYDGRLTLSEGEVATFTASLGEESIDFTVSYPKSPMPPYKPMTEIYTKEHPNVLWMYGYNQGEGDQPTVKLDQITFPNGRIATMFHAVYCIFFYNDETMNEYGAWNTMTLTEESLNKLGHYLHLQVYSSRETDINISFNDGIITRHERHLDQDGWTQIVVNMNNVDLSAVKNMSIRFPEQKELDCVLIGGIYFSDTPAYDKDTETGVETVGVENGNVDVFNASGMLLKKGASAAEALNDLPKGLYIVGGKKVVK